MRIACNCLHSAVHVRRLSKLLFAPVCLVALSLVATTTQAQTTALTMSGGSDFSNEPWSIGWEFFANSPLDVTELGFYQSNPNGLTENHDVGIYDLSGNLLVSTTVTNADPLDNQFRYHAVSPTLLAAGQDYVITSETGGEAWRGYTSITTAPELSYVEDRFQVSSSLIFPTATDGQPAENA